MFKGINHIYISIYHLPFYASPNRTRPRLKHPPNHFDLHQYPVSLPFSEGRRCDCILYNYRCIINTTY